MFFSLPNNKSSITFRSWVFTTIRQDGPKDLTQVESLTFTIASFSKALLISSLISLVTVLLFLAIEYLLEQIALIWGMIWLITAILYAFLISPYIYVQFCFRSNNLLDRYHRHSFGKYFCLYAFIGCVLGITILFLVTRQPGIISVDSEYILMQILFFGGMIFGGASLSLLHVLLSEKKNIREVKSWVKEWQQHSAPAKAG